jgi:hypothetical protein
MKSMISGYRHRPGEHCGSTVMRNMLLHYCDLDISETLTFGLGSGIECIYLSSPRITPEAVVFGRSVTLEQDLSEALGIDYVEEPEADDDAAWADVRREVMEGRLAVICSDIFYMDHRDYKVHFPFNRFALVGFDDDIEKAYIHDRTNLDPQRVSYRALALSRNPPEYPIYNLWGRFKSRSIRNSVEEACVQALKKAARRMTGADDHQKRAVVALGENDIRRAATGLAALEMFRDDLPSWRQKEDPAWLVSYTSRTIEVFGNGGGNFRRMYAAFLAEARVMLPDLVGPELPALAERSADLWTSLSQSLDEIAKREDEESWSRSVSLIDQILALETDLFQSLLEKFPE